MSRICHRAPCHRSVTTSLSLGGLAALARAAGRRHLERAEAPGEVAGGRAEDRLEASPSAAGTPASRSPDGRVYTLDLEAPIAPKAKGAADDGKPDGSERILCFDAATGEQLWSHKYPVKYGDLGGYANGPRTSPTIHDGKVYTLGAVGHLFCFDAKTGEIVWSHDTVAEFGAQVPEWGFAGSPVIDGDRVIVHLGAKDGGCVIAFDRHTGKEKWRSLDDPAGYCTPVVFDTPAGRVLVLWTPKNIHALDPETGKPLWKVPYEVHLRRLDRQPDLPRRHRLRHRATGKARRRSSSARTDGITKSSGPTTRTCAG